MKHKISILGLLFLTASICLVVWTFFTLSRPGYRSIELPDTCAGSHGWGGYEIRTGPDMSIPAAPRYTGGHGYTLSDESYDAVRRSRIMAEEELYLTGARLEMDYSGCGIELFLDGQLFYSDFQVSLRDSNGFLLLDEENFASLNEYRSIAVGLPMDFLGKTLTMRAIVQIVSQQVEKWRTRSRIVERSRFARENYEIIMQVDEDSRRRKHEMKHHMQTIYSLLKAREAKKAEEYIEKLVQETDQFAETAYSENIVINSIVGIRLNQAKKEGIAVRSHIHVPDRLEVDDVDLNNLLSNMLENAIEACMRMENRSRAYINLEIRKKQRFLFIECENSVDRGEKLASGQTTVKSDPAEHGFGLKTMNAVAEKYASIIQIEREPGWFVVRTNLCPPCPAPLGRGGLRWSGGPGHKTIFTTG